MKRGVELLLAAAYALDHGVDPFSVGWLLEHDVTMSEGYELAARLSLGAQMFVVIIDPEVENKKGYAWIAAAVRSMTSHLRGSIDFFTHDPPPAPRG
jgi:hypothetical protein